jgi:hypothetical protein
MPANQCAEGYSSEPDQIDIDSEENIINSEKDDIILSDRTTNLNATPIPNHTQSVPPPFHSLMSLAPSILGSPVKCQPDCLTVRSQKIQDWIEKI